MLSKKAKYAINALVYLAKQPQNEPIQISTISASENISRKFLESILLALRNAGIVNSKKGKVGGYYLLLSPEEIKMAEVMRIFDGPIALLPCVTHKDYHKCNEWRDEAQCGIRDIFADIRRKITERIPLRIYRPENFIPGGQQPPRFFADPIDLLAHLRISRQPVLRQLPVQHQLRHPRANIIVNVPRNARPLGLQ